MMTRFLCLIVAVCTLVVALGWSGDGHATSPDDHAVPAIEIPVDDPDSPQPDYLPDCDHHCHFGAHAIGLIVTNTEHPSITTGSVFGTRSVHFSDRAPSRPERPPSR